MSYDPGSKRLDYDASNNLEYFGINTIDGIDASLATWQIYKLVYSGSDLSSVEGPMMGTWDGRASLGWS